MTKYNHNGSAFQRGDKVPAMTKALAKTMALLLWLKPGNGGSDCSALKRGVIGISF
jgi:hypothetical protein